MTTKPTNPKDGIGITKVPLHLVSGIVKAYQAVAHYLGNVKYGAWNWRKGGARASVYMAALNRHMDRWWDGEEFDRDGTWHLANALCCINILIEAKELGVLVDDRPPSSGRMDQVYAQVETMMEKIKRDYGHMQPYHWTISDTNAPAAVPAPISFPISIEPDFGRQIL